MSDEEQVTDEDFYKALQSEDELGKVLRAHMHIEYQLNELLKLLIPDYEILEKMENKLEYFQKAHLACALRLKNEALSPLLAIGRLRNIFAHKLNTTLDHGRAKNLYETLSKNEKKVTQLAFRSMNKKMPDEGKFEFKNLEPADLFVLIAVCMRQMLMARRIEIEKDISNQ